MRFSKVRVFIVENASVDSLPLRWFSTVHTRTFENDRIARCDVS